MNRERLREALGVVADALLEVLEAPAPAAGQAQAQLQEAVKSKPGPKPKEITPHRGDNPTTGANGHPKDRKSRLIRTLTNLKDDPEACQAKGTTPEKVQEVVKAERGGDRRSEETKRRTAANDPTVNGAGPVRMVPPAELVVDPKRFQFRVSVVNLTGTDGRLRDCCKWNPALAGCLLVWADAGRLHLVDGHHRHRLAVANGVESVAVLLIDARDATQARTIGALSNLANGTATAPDVAKLLRDSGMTVAEVAQQGISARSKVLKDAAALVPLEARLFAKVCTGELELPMALALAAAGPHAIQRDLAKEAQRRGWDADQVREAAGLAQLATVTTSTASGCLPGLEALLAAENTDLGELLAVRAAIRRALSSEVLALSTVARKRSAQVLEGRGVAVVDREAASEARDSSRAQQRVFDTIAGHHGPLQRCIRELAQLVDDRHTAGEVVAQNIHKVRAAIEAELG